MLWRPIRVLRMEDETFTECYWLTKCDEMAIILHVQNAIHQSAKWPPLNPCINLLPSQIPATIYNVTAETLKWRSEAGWQRDYPCICITYLIIVTNWPMDSSSGTKNFVLSRTGRSFSFAYLSTITCAEKGKRIPLSITNTDSFIRTCTAVVSSSIEYGPWLVHCLWYVYIDLLELLWEISVWYLTPLQPCSLQMWGECSETGIHCIHTHAQQWHYSKINVIGDIWRAVPTDTPWCRYHLCATTHCSAVFHALCPAPATKWTKYDSLYKRPHRCWQAWA